MRDDKVPCEDRRATDLTNEELIALIKESNKQGSKEGIKEWLDEKFATFGRWSLISFAAWMFVTVVKFLVNNDLLGQIK